MCQILWQRGGGGVVGGHEGPNLGHKPGVEQVKVEKGWSLVTQVMGGAREGSPVYVTSGCPSACFWSSAVALSPSSAMSSWPIFFLRWLGKGRKKGKTRSKKEKRVARVQEDTFGRATVRSLGGFALGMTLSAAYGALVIFGQGYSIWYCLLSTITLAIVLGLGMAFSFKVRVTVLLMLPQFFSKEGKMVLILLAFGMAMEGPFANIIRNFNRSADTVSCGAELALNQTAEMLQRAREPLINALKKIKDIARKAKVVGDRVRKLFRSVMDAVRHVAHCMRNVWYFLLHMGDVCNEEMGRPYQKCVRIFDSAKDRCERAVPFLSFLCHIVLLFKYLCGLANILLVFCVIPEYIVPFLRRKVAEPVVAMLNRVRAEFEFNITTIHQYEVSVNASKKLSEVAFDIMEEVSERLQPVREAVGLFGYMSTLVMLYMYLGALLYRKHYLHEDSFDNIYITESFLEMDAVRRKTKRPSVLPLSPKESTKYIRPTSLVLPRKEQIAYALALARICRQFILVILLIVGDFSVYWLFDLVRYHLVGEITARAPVLTTITVNGSGYTSELYRDLVSSFDVLQEGNISVVSPKCRLHPSEPDYNGYLVIGLMYGICFFSALFGTYIQRMRRVLCAWYYPSRERERVCYLYNTILTRRTKLMSAVVRAVRQNSADEGHQNILLVFASNGQRPANHNPVDKLTEKPHENRVVFFFSPFACPSFTHFLTNAHMPLVSCHRFRLCRWLVKILGVHEAYCMGCGKIQRWADGEDFVTCITPACRGIYCPECYRILNNTCSICMAPLTYQGDIDEEIDSSDEEAMVLWTNAVRALRGVPDEKRQKQRRLLKTRIMRAVKGEGGHLDFSYQNEAEISSAEELEEAA
ncbi:DC-STAMP domain-containing protein 2 [Ahaetulla prasina]|uniref:DC-STAMP domain-containing protein 2 n=1 Tax=Ahaetulla prasina TaxID=499056 RepID=UPI00264724D6|nr:DC-STAMP domain-containing protein 2 [Ahaetulla prasina]